MRELKRETRTGEQTPAPPQHAPLSTLPDYVVSSMEFQEKGPNLTALS